MKKKKKKKMKLIKASIAQRCNHRERLVTTCVNKLRGLWRDRRGEKKKKRRKKKKRKKEEKEKKRKRNKKRKNKLRYGRRIKFLIKDFLKKNDRNF